MVRVILGSAVAAIAMFIIGFIFFATPLAETGRREHRRHAGRGGPAGACGQPAENRHLPGSRHEHAAANQHVFARPDRDGALQYRRFRRDRHGDARHRADPQLHHRGADRPRPAAAWASASPTWLRADASAVLIAVAAAAYIHLGEPIFYHHDWGHFIYLFVADALTLAAAGIIVAWFMPGPRRGGRAGGQPDRRR